MKINIKSKYFQFSLVSVILYIASLVITGNLIKNAVMLDHSTSPFIIISWIALIWISLAGMFLYKSTNAPQSSLWSAIVFFLTPIVFSPILAVFYVQIVLSPMHNLASQK
jgi:hypothetical protein